MTIYDVFNGDADGICALQQFRLANPAESTLITGVKRDIKLLDKFSSQHGDAINVFDISFDKNREALKNHLPNATEINYFDHHYAGDLLTADNLKLFIDTSAETCTSVIVDNYLDGKFRLWAIVGAFGDGFDDLAIRMSNTLKLNIEQMGNLQRLGVLMNYNGYGASLDDLNMTPTDLYQTISPYANPLDFRQTPEYDALNQGFIEDRRAANVLTPEFETEKHAVYMLPNEKWARRVSGVFANELNKRDKQRAHALLTEIDDEHYLVSVRAPAATKTGADDLCRQFETGGGRKAAAGINKLPKSQYDLFLEKFIQQFP